MKDVTMTMCIRSLLAGLAFAAMAGPALAHSTVKSTTPASGSVLLAAPSELVINFNEPARLTTVILDEAGMPERKLEFTPSGSSTTFTLPAPRLGSGRNEIKWKALSRDGHPISGSIIVVIRSGPAAPEGSPRKVEDHETH
jgi:methionine-rich copper-binding protein CopC